VQSRAGQGSGERIGLGFAAILGAPSPGLGCGRRRSWSGSAGMRGPAGRALQLVLLASPRCSGAGGRRCLPAGRATRVRAVMMVPRPLACAGRCGSWTAPSLLSKGYFIALQ
jgi:hypothetical protein